nr:hypothetical protein Q903MT_gene6013 [Picea sitchensis]
MRCNGWGFIRHVCMGIVSLSNPGMWVCLMFVRHASLVIVGESWNSSGMLDFSIRLDPSPYRLL